MSWTHWIIMEKQCREPIRSSLRSAADLLGSLLQKDWAPLVANAELFDISLNTRVRGVVDEAWSWPAGQYLWLTLRGVAGGIDVEYEDVTPDICIFLEKDLQARPADSARRRELLRAAGSGVLYTVRLSFFQPRVMYLMLIALDAVLAAAGRGYVYSADLDYLSPFIPLSGVELVALVSDPRWRVRTGFQRDLDRAIEELGVNSR